MLYYYYNNIGTSGLSACRHTEIPTSCHFRQYNGAIHPFNACVRRGEEGGNPKAYASLWWGLLTMYVLICKAVMGQITFGFISNQNHKSP